MARRGQAKQGARKEKPTRTASRRSSEAELAILLADDHGVFRHGLRNILESEFPSGTFAEVENAQEALEAVRRRAWDLAIMDVSMPGRSGPEILKEIKQVRPGLKVLFLSVHPEEQYAVRVLRAGAAGFINKVKAPREIVEAVKKVLDGGTYVSPALAERLAAQLSRGGEQAAHELLSDREFEVMRMMAAGETVKEIAGELHVSIQTISTYRANIFRKLNLPTDALVIRYALEHHLVT